MWARPAHLPPGEGQYSRWSQRDGVREKSVSNLVDAASRATK
jgi:hypothetical protein